LDDLFAAVRSDIRDTSRLEYGFETRLLARLNSQCENAASWSVWAWRLCPIFGSIVVALGIWTCCSPPDFDLQSAVKSGNDESQLVEFLTGKQL